MAKTVFIVDFYKKFRSTLIVPPEINQGMVEEWDHYNEIIEHLGNNDDSGIFTKGMKSWADLTLFHWQIFVTKRLLDMDTLTPEERDDMDHPVVAEFHFTVAGMIHRIELNCEMAYVESLRIHRIDEKVCVFEPTLMLQADKSALRNFNDYNDKKNKKSNFKVIVDNEDLN
jgi:hypothetical protein